jgi:hypothetical protein
MAEDAHVEGAAKKTIATSNLVGTVSGTMNSAFVEGSPVDVLLFGQKQRQTYSSSLGFTASSESSSGGA